MSEAPSTEKIALIGGTGDLGYGLALRWAAAGIPIVIGSRDAARAQDAAQRVRAAQPGASVEGLENSRAAAQATIIVVAVPFPAQAAILKGIRGAIKDAIVVDATVPLAATVGGKPTQLLGVWQGSAAEQAREIIPLPTPVLSAFHNVSAEALQDVGAPLDCDVLICGDDPAAKAKLFPPVRAIAGLRPVDAGALEMSRITEAITALLISVNRKNKVAHAGLRITGLP